MFKALKNNFVLIEIALKFVSQIVGKACLKQMTVVAATCPESLQGNGLCARLGRYTEIILFKSPIRHLRKVDERPVKAPHVAEIISVFSKRDA